MEGIQGSLLVINAIKVTAKRIDNDDWVIGHYFPKPRSVGNFVGTITGKKEMHCIVDVDRVCWEINIKTIRLADAPRAEVIATEQIEEAIDEIYRD